MGQRPLPTGPLTSASCPGCWEALPPRHTGTQTRGPLPGTRRGPAASGGAGPARVTEPQQAFHPCPRPQLLRFQAKHHSAGGGRAGVIFSKDSRKALFSLTFTGLNPQPPAQDSSLRRPAGKPPPRKRKPVPSALQLVLLDRSGRQPWGCAGGNSASFLVSGIINLGSKEDAVSRFRVPSFGSWSPKGPLSYCPGLLGVSTEVNFMGFFFVVVLVF